MLLLNNLARKGLIYCMSINALPVLGFLKSNAIYKIERHLKSHRV